MKRRLWVAALLLLAACDDKGKPASEQGSAPPAAASSSQARTESMTRQARQLSEGARETASAERASTGEAASGKASRLFDGAAPRDAGLTLPTESGAVYAGNGGSAARRARLERLTRGQTAAKARTDLATAAPPAPGSLRSASLAGLGAQSASVRGSVLAAYDAWQRRLYAAVEPVMSRAGWGAARPKKEPAAMRPTHVTVHHTEGHQTMSAGSTASAVRGIQEYHMVGRAKEGKKTFNDIGYHFLIDGEGRVVEGVPAERLGTHALGANPDNIGVALMGNFNVIHPTERQVESLTRLVSFLALKYRQNPARAGFLEPHRHYLDPKTHTTHTDCPGKNMMAIMARLHALVDSETEKLASRMNAAPKGQFVPVLAGA
jgi:hypothetical protein